MRVLQGQRGEIILISSLTTHSMIRVSGDRVIILTQRSLKRRETLLGFMQKDKKHYYLSYSEQL